MLDAGNFSSVSGRQRGILTEHFMRAMSLLNYQAVLVGSHEMQHGADFLLKANKKAKLPLVSSNILTKKGKPVFEDLIRIKSKGLDICVFGLSAEVNLNSLDTAKIRVVSLDSMAQVMAGRIKKKENGFVILLTNGGDDVVRRILEKQPFIDLVITADVGAYREEPVSVGKAWVVSHPRQTRAIHGIDFTWFAGKPASPTGFSVNLDAKYSTRNALDELFAQYDTALTTARLPWPKPADAQQLYAGSAACAPCHRDAFAKEQMGPHAKAFEPLFKVKATYNPSCLECHVTGFERENGFWDIETSKDMIHVQCEACHGPQKYHVDEATRYAFGRPDVSGTARNPAGAQYAPSKVGLYLCNRCHTDKYALKTSPEEAWKKIGHAKQP